MDELSKKIFAMRKDFVTQGLARADMHTDPLVQFGLWMKQAVDSGMEEPNAFVLSTLGDHDRISSRVLLLRGVDNGGFSFYTNYRSAKAKDIQARPGVSINFYWLPLFRQIRIEGVATRTRTADSDAYFASRPRESQAGAWASAQSAVLQDRAQLEKQLTEIEKKYEGQPIPRPPHWGGFVVKPQYMEFWQGRQSRLHDRFAYEPKQGGGWKISRLAP